MNNIENQKLICRYSEKSGISIEGTLLAFKEFVEAFSKAEGLYNFQVPKGSATPYARFLDQILLENGEGKLKICIKENRVICSGEKRYLDILVDNFLSLTQQNHSKGLHFHIEYHPDHFFLDEKAEPILLERIN